MYIFRPLASIKATAKPLPPNVFSHRGASIPPIRCYPDKCDHEEKFRSKKKKKKKKILEIFGKSYTRK